MDLRISIESGIGAKLRFGIRSNMRFVIGAELRLGIGSVIRIVIDCLGIQQSWFPDPLICDCNLIGSQLGLPVGCLVVI